MDDWGFTETDWGWGESSPDSGGFEVMDDLGSNYGGIFQGAGGLMPAVLNQGGMMQTAGPLAALAGPAMAGLATLGGRLAQMFGRGAGTFVLNGVRGSMTRLWDYTRQYGPTAVAAALGISLAQLAELLARAPTTRRKKRRGISARDLATTRRVGRWNQRINRLFGRGRGRSYRAGGRGHYHYFR